MFEVSSCKGAEEDLGATAVTSVVCKVLELLNGEDAPAVFIPHRFCESAAHGRRVLCLRGKTQGDDDGGGGGGGQV